MKSYLLFVAKFTVGEDRSVSTAVRAVQATEQEVGGLIFNLVDAVPDGSSDFIEATPADGVYTPLDQVVREIAEQLNGPEDLSGDNYYPPGHELAGERA